MSLLWAAVEKNRGLFCNKITGRKHATLFPAVVAGFMTQVFVSLTLDCVTSFSRIKKRSKCMQTPVLRSNILAGFLQCNGGMLEETEGYNFSFIVSCVLESKWISSNQGAWPLWSHLGVWKWRHIKQRPVWRWTIIQKVKCPFCREFCRKNICKYLGDNCIQNVHLGRYIVGYMVGNFVLRRRVSGAVKRNFRPYNRWYTSPNENFEYGYPHSNALFNIYSSKA